MNLSRTNSIVLATFIALLLFLIATGVDARERGDVVRPEREERVHTPMPPQEHPDNDPVEVIVIPQELLERWEEMTREGRLDEVDAEYHAYVEDGIYPTDEEEGDENEDGEGEGNGDDGDGNPEPPVCTEENPGNDRTDRIRDRVVDRTRGGVTTTEEPANCEDEELVVDEEEDTENEEEPPFAPTFEELLSSEIHRLLNDARAENGLDALIYNDTLGSLATEHSEWMAATGIFSHDRFDEGASEGCNFGCRLEEVSYPVSAWGENIAYRSGALPTALELAQMLMNGWLASPSHRANILSENFEVVGIGIARENNIVFATQDFARE